MMTLADIARSFRPNMTRNQLKSLRRSLRRAHLTHLNAEAGPYAIDPNGDEMTSRTVEENAVTGYIANRLAA